jgi:hypothetical protein
MMVGVCVHVRAKQHAERACLPHSDYVERRIVHPLAQHMLTHYLQTHQLMNAVEHGCAQRAAASTTNNKRVSVGHTRTCVIGDDVPGLSEVVTEGARMRVPHFSCLHTYAHALSAQLRLAMNCMHCRTLSRMKRLSTSRLQLTPTVTTARFLLMVTMRKLNCALCPVDCWTCTCACSELIVRPMGRRRVGHSSKSSAAWLLVRVGVRNVCAYPRDGGVRLMRIQYDTSSSTGAGTGFITHRDHQR